MGEQRLNEIDQSAAERAPAIPAQGPYCLSGPVARPDPQRVPVRGDLAHIGLAGKHFVPHYAVPQHRTIRPGGASLKAEPRTDAEELCVLAQGDSFDLLDITGSWAWGCVSLDGPVGFVHVDQIEVAR